MITNDNDIVRRFGLLLVGAAAVLCPVVVWAQATAAFDHVEKAVERLKKDVPRFTEWEVANPGSLSPELAKQLEAFKVVELVPKEAASKLRVLVAVAADGSTYRPTNDADLAVIISKSALGNMLSADAAGFAQQLAALRSFPDKAKLINTVAEIPPPEGRIPRPLEPETLRRYQDKITPLQVTPHNSGTRLTFFFCSQLGGGIHQMTVSLSGEKTWTIHTKFLGYAYLTGAR